jgi:hypothetical protein
MVATVGTFLSAGLLTGSAAAVAGTVAIGGALAGTAATIRSVKESKQAARASQRAAETRLAMQRQEASRQRRQAVRANILRRSRARAQAQAAGVETSSGFVGAMGSLSSQLGTNLGYGSQMSGLGEQYTTFTGEANLAASRAQTFQQVAKFGFGLAGKTGMMLGGSIDSAVGKVTGLDSFATTGYR